MVRETHAEELKRLREENAALKSKSEDRSLKLKVSQKGGVSVYGLGRFPVTLYKGQWLRLLEITDELSQFLKDHDSELKTKD